MAEAISSESPSRKDKILSQLKFEFISSFRMFIKWFAGSFIVVLILCLTASVYVIITHDEIDYNNIIGVILVGLYGCFWGGVISFIIGACAFIYRLIGAGIFVPLIVIPLSVNLSFWAGNGLITDASIAFTESLSGSGFPGARVGGIFAVIILPFFVLSIILKFEFWRLIITMSIFLLIGLTFGLIISIPWMGILIFWKIKKFHKATL